MRMAAGKSVKRHASILTGLALLAVVVGVVAPFIGPTSIPFAAVFGGGLDESQRTIFWEIRVPRVVLAGLVGGGLAVGGLVFQVVFRNVLATPYTLGVASGASLGAAFSLWAGVGVAIAGIPATALAALVGGGVVVWGMDRLAARGAPPTTLLLAGVIVAFVAGSLISFLEYSSGANAVVRMSRWLMGGLDAVRLEALGPLLPLILGGLGVAVYVAGDLNLLALGDELALGRGVDAPRVRRIALGGTSIMVAALVSVVGPIGFVGIVVPHALRLAIGHEVRLLVPASFCAGATFLVGCDTLARTIAAPSELPVGIVTALVGGPVFLYLLLTRVEGGAGSPLR